MHLPVQIYGETTVALPSFTMAIIHNSDGTTGGMYLAESRCPKGGEGRGRETARDCDRRTAFRKTWEELEKKGDKSKRQEELTVDGTRCVRRRKQKPCPT